MLVSDILSKPTYNENVWYSIRTKCSQFISESNGIPVFKKLQSSYGTASKVKVRHTDTFTTNSMLDEAFNDRIESTLVPVVTQPLDTINESDEWYYVFPVNGYRYLYSDLLVDYRYHTNKLVTKSIDRAIIIDSLKESYIFNQNLSNGLNNSVEILFYNVPTFYVVSHKLQPEYKSLLSSVCLVHDTP